MREIRAGDLVIVSLTAANRDPATFPDPDTFDISRPNARSHLAFAQGPHACVGLHLARLETRAALDAVARRLARPRDSTPDATPPTGVIFRKPRSLPVRWDEPPCAGRRAGTYQTSPGRHSQLMPDALSTVAVTGVNRTMM